MKYHIDTRYIIMQNYTYNYTSSLKYYLCFFLYIYKKNYLSFDKSKNNRL